jgi:hypothetical protein
MGKNKKNSYEMFGKKSKKMVDKLIEEVIVPNRKIMVEAPLQIAFINKKRMWECSKLYAIRFHISDL